MENGRISRTFYFSQFPTSIPVPRGPFWKFRSSKTQTRPGKDAMPCFVRIKLNIRAPPDQIPRQYDARSSRSKSRETRRAFPRSRVYVPRDRRVRTSRPSRYAPEAYGTKTRQKNRDSILRPRDALATPSTPNPYLRRNRGHGPPLPKLFAIAVAGPMPSSSCPMKRRPDASVPSGLVLDHRNARHRRRQR